MSLKIKTFDGSEIVLNNNIMKGFKDGIRGKVLTMDDAEYEQVRIVFNGMIDKRPAIIVRCTGTADVIDAVKFANKHRLLLAVRGGGHNVAGHSTCDGGMMIDLQLMRSVDVDPLKRVARVQGGATLGDLDRETQAFGLAVPLGVVSHTGVAGLTLGGGFSWLRAKYGLTIDNLISADIVTSDGRFLNASEEENEDLFWAIRGGGGNFGVVTSFEFRLHPVGPVVMFCAPMYSADNASHILRFWREFMVDTPDEFTSQLFMQNIPESDSIPSELHGKAVVVPASVYLGPVEEGEKFIQPLRELDGLVIDQSGPKQFRTIQSMFDQSFEKGALQNYWKSLYLDTFSDEVIELLVKTFKERSAKNVANVVQYLHGASSRIAADATAFGDRSSLYMIELNSSWTDPEENERNIEWTRQRWEEFKRFSSGKVYLNHDGLHEGGEDVVQNTFADNYKRLQDIKKKYDPDNLFRLNANIIPAK